MRIGYLMNSYPMTSTTFVRRELRAMEAEGVPVKRFAIRPWTAGPLVDPADREEAEATRYLLTGSKRALIGGFLSELVQNPRGMLRALGAWTTLLRNAGGGLIPHVAYLLEAAALKRAAVADDLAHIHVHFSTNSAAVALLSRRMGGPGFSFTAHGPDEFVDPGRSSLGLKVREARFVAAISNYCRVQLALSAGMECWDKLHIVRCGIDVAALEPTDAPFDASAPFVCVGRLCPQKAQVLIVQALGQVVREHPGVRVVFIGDGETREAVQAEIARQGVAANVDLAGWQDNAEVHRILGQARALLLPSFAEGLPVVIMEALALGRPAISTYIAGIPELLDEDCGWIIPAGSVADIARAMIEALKAPPEVMAAKGREGRARVEGQHDLGANARALLQHIRDAVTGG